MVDGHILWKEALDVLIVHQVEGVAFRFQQVAFDAGELFEKVQRNDGKRTNDFQRTIDLFNVR